MSDIPPGGKGRESIATIRDAAKKLTARLTQQLLGLQPEGRY